MFISVQSVFEGHLRFYVGVFIHLVQKLCVLRLRFLLLLFLLFSPVIASALLVQRHRVRLHLVCFLLFFGVRQIKLLAPSALIFPEFVFSGQLIPPFRVQVHVGAEIV